MRETLKSSRLLWILLHILIEVVHVRIRCRIKFIADLLLKHYRVCSYHLRLWLHKIIESLSVICCITGGKSLLIRCIKRICHKLLLLILWLVGIKLRIVITIDINKILLLLIGLFRRRFLHMNIWILGIRTLILTPHIFLIAENLILLLLLLLRFRITVKFKKVLNCLFLLNNIVCFFAITSLSILCF